MRSIHLALFAEGPSDHRFLPTLLLRLTEELCRSARETVEVWPEVVSLHSPDGSLKAGHNRTTRICDSALSARQAWNLLFIHADGDSQPVEQYDQLVAPAIRALRAESRLAGSHRCIPVIPVRETESWMIADFDALCSIFRRNLENDPSDFGLDFWTKSPRRIEMVEDPKAILRAVARYGGRRSRADREIQRRLPAIADRARFSILRQLQAFTAVEEHLKTALRDLRILEA
ncbi:MAG: DUF4276 family protein [Acidobacteriota bacterium]